MTDIDKPTNSLLERSRAMIPCAVLLVLFFAALLPPCALRMHLFTLLSGVVPLLFFRRRWGIVSLLLLSLPVGLLLWSTITLVVGSVSVNLYPCSPWIVVALCGAIVLRQQLIHHRIPQIRVAPTPAEWCALVFVILGAVITGYISIKNGLWTSPDGNNNYIYCQVWTGNDTMYMCALAEQILARGGWPTENPFIAGIGNFYPSFCHCGLAGLTNLYGDCVFVGLMSWIVTHGALSCGLMALVCCRLAGSMLRRRGVYYGAFAAAFFAIQRNDLIFLAQTNFLVMPVLFLLVWLLFDLKGRAAAARATAVAYVIGLLLILSHTVSTVGGGILIATVALGMLSRPSTRKGGLYLAGGMVGMAALVLFFNHFPYSGVAGYHERDWMTWQMCFRTLITPVLVVLIAALVSLVFMRGVNRFRAGFVIGTFAVVGTLYMLQGIFAPDGWNRWFRMFNSVRFWQTGLMFAMPFFAYITRRHLALAFPPLMIVLTFLIPNSTMELFFMPMKQPQFIFKNATDDGVLKFMREETALTDVMSSNYPHFFSALTGRSELMADEENLWGMDTLAPEKFWSMRNEYLCLWTPDSWSSITTEMRAEVVATAGVRWLIYSTTEDDYEGTQCRTRILEHYPKGFVTPIMFDHPLALFRTNWSQENATTASLAKKETTNEDE